MKYTWTDEKFLFIPIPFFGMGVLFMVLCCYNNKGRMIIIKNKKKKLSIKITGEIEISK